MINHDFDRAIGALARRQHGVFHMTQAHELGGTVEMLATRVRNGAYVKLDHRVLAIVSHPATWQRQHKAAELSVPGSALAARSAALVHELTGARVLRPALVAPPSANRRSRLAQVRRSTSIEAVTVKGFRVTSVRSTLFDLLGCTSVAEVERAIDDALAERRISVDDLIVVAKAASEARRPYVGTWRALVEERTEAGWQPTESELERYLDAILRSLPGHVEVERQATPRWWKPRSHRVDAYLPAWNLIVEADGRRWHTRVADFDRDRWRDNVAVAHGHRVLRFTHTHLSSQPQQVLQMVLDAGRHQVGRADGDVHPAA
ncbi:MAG: DUF559 domain-containing protein [Acidimicrobiales bacterium]|nr:DUF559 domain-containing protein [Acidimicrobiales bacterium]